MTLKPKPDHVVSAEKMANMIFENGPAKQQEMLETVKTRLKALNAKHLEILHNI